MIELAWEAKLLISYKSNTHQMYKPKIELKLTSDANYKTWDKNTNLGTYLALLTKFRAWRPTRQYL